MFAKQTKLTDDEVIIPAPTQYTNFADTAASVMPEPTITAPAAPAPTPAPAPVDDFAPKAQTKNVMAAVNVIRDAVSKLEALGYSVDADEIDLDSIYQVIIKIDK